MRLFDLFPSTMRNCNTMRGGRTRGRGEYHADVNCIVGYRKSAMERASAAGRPQSSELAAENRVLCTMAWPGRSMPFKSMAAHSGLPRKTVSLAVESALADLSAELSGRLARIMQQAAVRLACCCLINDDIMGGRFSLLFRPMN